jgi:hypothetical protein
MLVPASGDVDGAGRAGILGVADVAADVVAAPIAVVPATVLGAVGAAGTATVVVTVTGGELALVLIVGTETVVLTTGGDTGVLTVGADTVVLATEVDTVVLIVGDGTDLADGKVGRTVTVGRPTVEATAGTCATKYPAIATAPSTTTAQRFIWPSELTPPLPQIPCSPLLWKTLFPLQTDQKPGDSGLARLSRHEDPRSLPRLSLALPPQLES